MKKLLTALLLVPAVTTPAWATSITAIYGGGNPDAGWTTATSGELQLGLRAKDRTTGDTSNVNGTYSFATAPSPRGLWNYEFSINSDVNSANGTTSLAASPYDFYLTVDQDPSQGFSGVTVDPLTHWFDNSFGNNSTANGAGVEGLAAILGGGNNLVQNSQNITFAGFAGIGGYPGGAELLAPNATYTYELFAVAKGAGVGGARVAEVDINVVVGAGGTAVPDSGATALLLGLGVAGMAGVRFRKRA